MNYKDIFKGILIVCVLLTGAGVHAEEELSVDDNQAATESAFDSQNGDAMDSEEALREQRLNDQRVLRHRLIVEAEKERREERRVAQEEARQRQIDMLMSHTRQQSESPQQQRFPVYGASAESQQHTEAREYAQPQLNQQRSSSTWVILLVFIILGGAIFWWWKNYHHNAAPQTQRGRRANRDRPRAEQTFSGNSSASNDAGQDRNQSQQNSRTQPSSSVPGHERAHLSLNDFFSSTPQIPVAYREQLNSLTLDFSTASLQQLDHFLLQLRRQTRPDYETYCEQVPYQQMVIFCGVYLGTTIARLTHQSIKWLSYAELKSTQQFANIPETLGTFLSCMLGDSYHHLPIEIICDALFADASGNTCVERLHFYQQHAKPLVLMPADSKLANVQPTGDSKGAWVTAMQMAGHLASLSLYMVEGGAALAPTMLRIKDGKFLVTRLVDSDPEAGLVRLQNNPENLPYQILAYDSFANLPYGRMDALAIHVRSYAPHAADWILTIPYQPAQHEHGFAFFSPILVSASTGASYNPLLFKAFYDGAEGFNSPSDTRQRFFNNRQDLI